MLEILPVAAILLFQFAVVRDRPPNLSWTCVVRRRFGRSFVISRRYYGELTNPTFVSGSKRPAPRSDYLGLCVCRRHRIRNHDRRTDADRRRAENEFRFRWSDLHLGLAPDRRAGCRHRGIARRVPNRHRHASTFLHRCGLRHHGLSDHLRQQGSLPPALRLGRGDDVDRHRSLRDRIGTLSRIDYSRPQYGYRRVRADRLCQSVSDDVSFGLRADFQLAPTSPLASGERRMR